VVFANAALRYVEPREYDAVSPVTPSLMFVNGHYVSEPSNPVAQSVVHVGGIHLKPPEKLPEVRKRQLTPLARTDLFER
jgi:glucuronosyltransferase